MEVGVHGGHKMSNFVVALLGLLINSLALRLRQAPGLPFSGLLAAVRESTLGAYAHQDLPFEKLVAELRPNRDLSRSPLFQAMLILHSAPMPPLALGSLALEVMDPGSAVAKLDLTLSLTPGDGRFAGSLEYNTDLFDPATARRLARGFERLLAAAAAEPGRALRDLPVLSARERRQIVTEWNDTAVAGIALPVLPEIAAQAS